MTKEEVAKLTNDQVLELAGNYGPGIIGKELYDRAQTIQKVNPGGALGPAIIGDVLPPAAIESETEPEAPLPTVRALADAIADMPEEAVRALMARDTRKSALEVYLARIDELEGEDPEGEE